MSVRGFFSVSGTASFVAMRYSCRICFRRSVTLALIATLYSCAFSARAIGPYFVTELGFSATAINNYGQVVGAKGTRAVLWQPTNRNGTSGAVDDLGDAPGLTGYAAFAINASGQIVGRATSSSSSYWRSFLWQPSSPNSSTGTMMELGHVPEHLGEAAHAINEVGQVAGISQGESFGQHAFLWNPTTPNATSGAFFDLGDDLPNDAYFSQAWAINAVGQVAGRSTTMSDAANLSLWQPAKWNGDTGTLVDLKDDLHGGPNISLSFAINDLGQVAGESAVEDGNHAFLWQPLSPNGTTGTMLDLGELPGGGNESVASAVNNLGQVVGRSSVGFTEHSNLFHAFLWHSTHGMVDLNNYLDPISGAGRTVGRGTSINDRGQIIADNYLLTPMRDPTSVGDYNLSGDVDAADYAVWRNAFNQLGTGLAADGNGNGMIDSGDYDVWRAHFGQTTSAPAAFATVPEPSALLLLLTCGLVMLGCVRRRHRSPRAFVIVLP